MSYKHILGHDYYEYAGYTHHSIFTRYYIGITMYEMMGALEKSISSFGGTLDQVHMKRDISFDYKKIDVVRKYTFVLDNSNFEYMLFLIIIRSLDDYIESHLNKNWLDNDDRKLL